MFGGLFTRRRVEKPIPVSVGVMPAPTGTRGVLKIMGRNGDTQLTYDRTDTTTEGQEALRQAEAIFTEKRKEGYLAYSVFGSDHSIAHGGGMALATREPEVLTKFDPSVLDIVMVPPVVGG